MSNRRHDYDLMEREYVSGDMSLRELARGHTVAHSLIMNKSKQREWTRKREEFRSRASEKAVTFMADKEGLRRVREAEVRDETIELIAETVQKARADLKATHKVFKNNEWLEEPVYRLHPRDVVALIDRFQVLFGKPSQITEDRSLDVSIGGTATPEVLQQFIDATRGLDAGTDQSSPIPRTDRSRKN